MQDILETASRFGRTRTKIHIAPEGIAISRRNILSSWEKPKLITFEEIRYAIAQKRNGRFAVEIGRAQEPFVLADLSQPEAEWVAALINEHLGTRARRADARFAQLVALEEFPAVIQALLHNGEREAVSVVDFLLLQAAHHQASDIHIEPFHNTLRVRLRIDGILHDVAELSPDLQMRILARLKVLAKLTVFRQDIPQEGRTIVESDEHSIDMRVSVLPTIHGEKAVIRLFDSTKAIFALEDLGMSAETLERYRELVNRPQGTLLLTGPANSGKTTTLYSTLTHLHKHRRDLSNIVTVEDPVEYDLQVVSQTQIAPAAGLNFAAALRTVLRQDPEVIMVGEIRDPETAAIAVRAGLTGHLILSTSHARSAAGVFARLIEMEVEPFLVASSVTGVIEQRLVRKNCPDCAQPYQPDPGLLRRVGLDSTSRKTYSKGAGCDKCRHSGFVGRTGVFSLITVDDTLRELIMSRATLAAFEEAARRSSRGLLAEGLARVQQGVTTLEELLRVIGPEA